MSEDKIFFNRASELAAELAFTASGVGARELCRMQSEAVDNDRMLNEQELPFLEAAGFRRCEDDDVCSAFRLDGRNGLTVLARIFPDGHRTVEAAWDGRKPTIERAESSRSVVDAAFGCLLKLVERM